MENRRTVQSSLRALPAAALALAAGVSFAHGDVTPQAVDTSTLKQVGKEWLSVKNCPGDKEAIRIGSRAFNQNCARRHGAPQRFHGDVLTSQRPGQEGE